MSRQVSAGGLNAKRFRDTLLIPESISMRYLVPILCLAVLLLAAAPARAQSRLTGVDPGNGKIGDIVAAAGENIDKAKVVELYLTDGAKDFKVQILEQTDALIKFKVP